MPKTGRNDPCPCGSGKKFKKCCLHKAARNVTAGGWLKLRQTEGELVHALLAHSVRHYGPTAMAEAWDEFSLWEDVPMDAGAQPEVETSFLPWFVFNWLPDDAEAEAAGHRPEMPIARHYLMTRGERVGALERRFIETISAEPYSFFVVTAVVPGQSLSLQDVLLGRKVDVHERQASTTLRRGSIIFSRIVSLDGDAIMVGCAPIAIPPRYLRDLHEVRDHMTEVSGALDRKTLFEHDIEIRELYYEFRDLMLNPVPPQLANTDGDPLEPTTLYYALHCSPDEALEALASLSPGDDAEALRRDAELDDQGQVRSVRVHWSKKGNAKHGAWEYTTLGVIQIHADKLTVVVNSRERAEAIKRKITRRLGRRATFQRAEVQSAESLWEAAAAGTEGDAGEDIREATRALEATPEVQAKLRELAAEHWSNWLDTPLPALEGETPREATQSAAGRERLEAVLLEFEWQSEAQQQPFTPDVAALRRELGLK